MGIIGIEISEFRSEIIDNDTYIYSQDNHVATLENYTGSLIEDWQIILMNEELSNIWSKNNLWSKYL